MNYEDFKSNDFAADDYFYAYYVQREERAVAFWENWIQQHPDHAEEIATAKMLLDMVTVRLPERELAVERERMRKYISQTKVKPMYGRKRRYFVVAASIVLAVGLATIFTLSERNRATKTNVAQDLVRYENPNGKKTRIKLTDGTVITLKGGSVLQYPKSFASDSREVFLEGEAYFAVAHDSLKPFTVHTGDLQTQVLGTEFNVTAYQSDSLVQVALVKGKVKVSNGRLEQVLSPGKQVNYSRSRQKLETGQFEMDVATGWLEDKVVFKNADFRTIAGVMEHTYGYQLVDQTTNEVWSYTGTFEKEDALTVIENICYSKKLDYKIKGHTIYISAKK